MEDKIIIPKAEHFSIPRVEFYAQTGACLIEGESFLEDTKKFYQELITWMQQYFENGNTKLELNLKLLYFNTGSSRAILVLLRNLKEYQDKGNEVTINWHYPEPDYDDMLEEGEDFATDAEIEINFIPYPDALPSS